MSKGVIYYDRRYPQGIFHVDLTTNNIYIEQPSNDFYRLLAGGRAVIDYFLLRDLTSNTHPLSSDNLLIFAPGIIQGTSPPGSGRHAMGVKSSLKGAISSSEVGWRGIILPNTTNCSDVKIRMEWVKANLP